LSKAARGPGEVAYAEAKRPLQSSPHVLRRYSSCWAVSSVSRDVLQLVRKGKEPAVRRDRLVGADRRPKGDETCEEMGDSDRKQWAASSECDGLVPNRCPKVAQKAGKATRGDEEFETHLFPGRGLVRCEGGVLEPVAVVQVVGIEEQWKWPQVFHPLESVLDERGGDSIEGHGLFGGRARAARGGLFGQRRHGIERVSISEQITGHFRGGHLREVFPRWAMFDALR
jgi:hypothetical protein